MKTINTKAAIKTKRAPVLWDNNNKKTVYYFGDKDTDGKAIWYDEDGNKYEMIYSRLAKKYSLNPYRQ